MSPGVESLDIRDAKLPGNTLIDAIFNRRLMSWSDRGGASMLIGDCWAERCTEYLSEASGALVPVPGSEPFELRSFIRLDDNPQVEREANLNQLENPDFILIGVAGGAATVVQAADAKFAADRIKASQVSVSVVEELLRIPATGATRAVLQEALQNVALDDIAILPGVFLAPDSSLTDLLLERAVLRGDSPAGGGLLARVPVDPAELFAPVAPARLIPTLARADRLPVTPQQNLLAAVYYLRLACACFYFWDEQTRPLLSFTRQMESAPAGLIAAEISRRLVGASSAFNALLGWHRDLRDIMMARKTVIDAVTLPIGIGEIRERVSSSAAAGDPAAVRRVRKDLELEYRALLNEHIGTIYPDDARALQAILRDIRAASRDLRPRLLERLNAAVEV
jgi:hypothetical protein